MLYNKKKDELPEVTVQKIKDILKKIGIENLKEIIGQKKVDFHGLESLTITLSDDLYYSSNGKGITLDYAKASAYGEFMERLQNGASYNITPPDTKLIKAEDFLNNSILKYWVSRDNTKINEYIERILDICDNYKTQKNSENRLIEVLPFYHVNNGKIEYISPHLLQYTGGFTGSCAGNTPYEALVEGLSEVFERYVIRKAITESVSFPDIPEEYYLKYDAIKKIVDYIKEIGLSVTVKDASFNGKYPVICTVLKDEENKGYYAWFGAHPFLPVAIERCFTETFQGMDFSSKQYVSRYFKFEGKKDNPIPDAKIDNAFNNRFLEVNTDFFSINPEYIFNENNWINNFEVSNKELFHAMINKLIQSDMDVFIRDVSFLGFPSYTICIPELMSNFYNINPHSGIDLRMNYYKCVKIMGENIPSNLTEKEILDFFKYFFCMQFINIKNYKNIEMLYIITLLREKLYKKALAIITALKKTNKYSKYIKMLSFLENYILMILERKNNNDINNGLSDKYGKYFTLKMKKIFLSENSFENAINTLKKSKLYSLKHIKEEDLYKKEKIVEKVMNIYKKNIPDQMLVKKLLET